MIKIQLEVCQNISSYTQTPHESRTHATEIHIPRRELPSAHMRKNIPCSHLILVSSAYQALRVEEKIVS